MIEVVVDEDCIIIRSSNIFGVISFQVFYVILDLARFCVLCEIAMNDSGYFDTVREHARVYGCSREKTWDKKALIYITFQSSELAMNLHRYFNRFIYLSEEAAISI